MKFKKYIVIALSVSTFLLIPPNAHAARLYLLPETNTVGVNQEFEVDVFIDSEDEGINAAQATLHFPSDKLEVIKIDRAESAFKFWVEDPLFSNDEGTVQFIGGTSKGISGPSLKILNVKFRARGAGEAELSISDAAVVAADGKGTNVLETIEGVKIGVGTKVVAPPSVAIPKELLENPEPVSRKSSIGTKLPELPVLRVPLYPEEERWYNRLGEVKVFWELPEDVDQVATRIAQVKNASPGEKEKELYTGKSFGVLKEGVWYVHVQFHNNVGWGKFQYRELKIDTTSPLPFEAQIDAGVSENPSPVIHFETSDSLSGISEYAVFVDGSEVLRTASTSATLPPQAPGMHRAVVRAFDLAKNSVEDDLDFEILPLPTPQVRFVTKTVSEGEVIFSSGNATPNAFVRVSLANDKNQNVFRREFPTDEVGNWEAAIEEPLPVGAYVLTASARDGREAISFESEGVELRVKTAPILTFGFVEIGWFELFIILILLVVSALGLFGSYRLHAEKQRSAYSIVAARDVDKLNALLEKDLDELENSFKNREEVPERSRMEMQSFVVKMRGTIARMKKYLGEEVRKIK